MVQLPTVRHAIQKAARSRQSGSEETEGPRSRQDEKDRNKESDHRQRGRHLRDLEYRGEVSQTRGHERTGPLLRHEEAPARQDPRPHVRVHDERQTVRSDGSQLAGFSRVTIYRVCRPRSPVHVPPAGR